MTARLAWNVARWEFRLLTRGAGFWLAALAASSAAVNLARHGVQNPPLVAYGLAGWALPLVPLLLLPVLGSVRRRDEAAGVHELVHSRPVEAWVARGEPAAAAALAGHAAALLPHFPGLQPPAGQPFRVFQGTYLHTPRTEDGALVLMGFDAERAASPGGPRSLLRAMAEAYWGRLARVPIQMPDQPVPMSLGDTWADAPSLYHQWVVLEQAAGLAALEQEFALWRQAADNRGSDRRDTFTELRRSGGVGNRLSGTTGGMALALWNLSATPGREQVLDALVAAALLWPAGDPEERRILAWLLKGSELFGPPVLMAMVSGILLVHGRVDERWGATPPGFPGLFRVRWLLVAGFFSLALALFLALAGWRTGPGFPFVRTFASSLVTSALFSLLVPVFHTRTGSAAAGWAAGLALYFATVTVAQFWCPYDSTYQLWLPFAGLSDAGPWPLFASKAVYGLGALGVLAANLGSLRRPERLIGRAD